LLDAKIPSCRQAVPPSPALRHSYAVLCPHSSTILSHGSIHRTWSRSCIPPMVKIESDLSRLVFAEQEQLAPLSERTITYNLASTTFDLPQPSLQHPSSTVRQLTTGQLLFFELINPSPPPCRCLTWQVVTFSKTSPATRYVQHRGWW
jgi:hypothetical protein